MTERRWLTGLVGMVMTGLAVLAPAAPAEASWFCHRSGDHLTVRIIRGDTVRLSVWPDGSIHYSNSTHSQWEGGCNGASVTNLRRIDVRSPGRTRLVLDESHRPFGPGTRAERGVSEIEIVLHDVKRLWWHGTDAPDVVRLGRDGLDTSADGDADVRWSSTLREVQVHPSGGDDSVTAQGGGGTGGRWPAARDFLSFGGDGADTLVGHAGRDALSGDQGPDILRGMAGPDEIIGVDGNPDPVLDGGPGTDVADVDPVDVTSGIEYPHVVG